MSRRVAGVECYLTWGARQAIRDQASVDSYGLSWLIYRRACQAKARACL